jgi:hypothetical protein
LFDELHSKLRHAAWIMDQIPGTFTPQQRIALVDLTRAARLAAHNAADAAKESET